MIISPALEKLIQALTRFPGIGKKTAQRMAWYLVSQDKSFGLELAEIIKQTVENITTCSLCNMLSESDPCPFCTSSERTLEKIREIQKRPGSVESPRDGLEPCGGGVADGAGL